MDLRASTRFPSTTAYIRSVASGRLGLARQQGPTFNMKENLIPLIEPQDESNWATVEEWPDFRPATLGDRGNVLGALSHDGTGLLRLVIQIAPDQLVLLSGHWQHILHLVDEFAYRDVEVVEGIASSIGFHDLQPSPQL